MQVEGKVYGTIRELIRVKLRMVKVETSGKSISIPLILQKTVATFKPNTLSPYSYFLYKSKKFTFIFKGSENFPTYRISCVEECWLNFITECNKIFKMNQICSKYK